MFAELIPEDKKRKKDSKNISVLQNNLRNTSRCVKIPLESGASAYITHHSFVHTNKFNIRQTSANKWSMMDGSFPTLCEAEVEIKLPELNFTAHILALFRITSQPKSN